MKIENKVYDNHITFGKLECGDVFIHDDGIYMKTTGDDNIENTNAVDLESGHKVCFFSGDKVQLVTATLTIK